MDSNSERLKPASTEAQTSCTINSLRRRSPRLTGRKTVYAPLPAGLLAVLRNKSLRCRIQRVANKCVTLLRLDSANVTLAILPTRNVDLTSLPIARIVLIFKAELFLRTTTGGQAYRQLLHGDGLMTFGPLQ
jgi:hypothetical protein